MNMKILALIALLCALPPHVLTYPSGAPPKACNTLTPVHEEAPVAQSTASPFTVTANKIGDKITVTITSPTGRDFQGFILQARYGKNQKIANGKFLISNGVTKTIDCSGEQNTLTHTSPNSKSQVVTEWEPSTNMNDDIIFRATVAATYYEFWTGIDSEPIKVVTGEPITGESVTAEPDTGEPSVISGRKAPKKQETTRPEKIYEDCFVTKGCFGFPIGCIQRTDCEILLSYGFNSEGILFRLTGVVEPENYMAMALSMDQKMGDDAVMDCSRQNEAIILRNSWNEGKKNIRNKELLGTEFESKFENNITSCQWTTEYAFQRNGFDFDLYNKTYYIFIAKGPLSNGKVSYHSGKIFTQDPVNFTMFEALEGGKTSDSIKIHGTFMVTAWVGFVSIAILLARHFKSAFENQTLCGVKIWFALHRGLMIIALMFVIVAFIVIFVHKDGWNYSTKNPHAILGCIATALGLAQPLMAAFRPAPDHDKRPVFNWLHWIVGNSAQIIAVIAMFFAVSLQTSGLKDNFYWVLAVYVVVFLLFHFLFQLQVWTTDKKRNSEIKMNELSRGGRISKNMQNSMDEKNPAANLVRIFLLGWFVVFVLGIVVAAYVLIGMA